MKKLLFVAVIYLMMNISYLYAGNIDKPQEASLEWKAGVAKVNITPQQSMWLAGYSSRERPSEGIIHDLWAKALAFEDENGHRAVLVTADFIRFPKTMSDRIRYRLLDKYDLSKAQIMLNASHTHTGPEVEVTKRDHLFRFDLDELEKIAQYADVLEDMIVVLVGEALQSMEPAQLYVGNGVTRFAVNRRNNPERTLEDLTQLAGPYDHAVPVIKVENRYGELLAVAFGYACHSTVLSSFKWSGDYAGFAQIELENTYPGATALFFQGAGADQNPLPRRTEALAEQYGKQLAAAVKRVLNEDMRSLSSLLTTTYSEVDLHLSNPPSKDRLIQIINNSAEYSKGERFRAWALLGEIEQGDSQNTRRFLEETLMTNTGEIPDYRLKFTIPNLSSGIATYPFPVQVWKLDNQPIISMGGEPVIDYAIELKRIFGENIFVLGYTNDAPGYIPSARVIEEGGYEGNRPPRVIRDFTTWDPNIETMILNEIVKLAREAGVPVH